MFGVVLIEYARHVYRHRTVEVHRHLRRNRARRLQLRDVEHERLRAVQGKSRNDNHAAARKRAIEDFAEHLHEIVARIQSIAIGRVYGRYCRPTAR